MTTYVLVHGGGHGGWCYQRVARRLRAHGHDVYTPTLTGLGERSHLLRDDVDLEVHIQDIVSVLHYEDLREVILVGHSYGGIVITGAADRAIDRVAQLVYLDAAIPVDGESLASMEPMRYRLEDGVRDLEGTPVVGWLGPEAARAYGVTDDDDVAWMQDRLTPHPARSLTAPLRLSNEEALKGLRRSVVLNTHVRRPPENEMNPAYLAMREQRARAMDGVWEVDAGHDLMITAPDEVAGILLELANIHNHH